MMSESGDGCIAWQERVPLYPGFLAEVGYLGDNEDDDAVDYRNEHALVSAIYDGRWHQIGWGNVARLIKGSVRLLQDAIHLIEAHGSKKETAGQRDEANVANPGWGFPCCQENQRQQ